MAHKTKTQKDIIKQQALRHYRKNYSLKKKTNFGTISINNLLSKIIIIGVAIRDCILI